MKLPFIFFLFFISSIAKAQNEKPIQYFDIDGSEISIQLYKSKSKYNANSPNYLTLRFENDSILAFKLFYQKNYGTLDAKNLELLKSYLNKNSEEKLSKTKSMIIQYHPGKDRCNRNRERAFRYHLEYPRKIRRFLDYKTYLIYKELDNYKNKRSRKIDWIHDDEKIIEQLFFNFHFPCGSFVIVSPEGNYISYYGEYNSDRIVDIAMEIKQSLEN